MGELAGIRRVRFTTSHPRDFGRDIVDAIDAVPTLCDHVHLPVQSGSTRVLDAMQRLYTREQYLERIAWMKAAKREISITTRHDRRLSRRDRSRVRRDAQPAGRSRLRRRVRVQVFAAAEYAVAEHWTMRFPTKRNHAACEILMAHSASCKPQATRDT